VIVQPHVRESDLSTSLSANTASARQTRLLYTLLHAVKSDVNRYGVEFDVIVAKWLAIDALDACPPSVSYEMSGISPESRISDSAPIKRMQHG
jgi:hypothetical protein